MSVDNLKRDVIDAALKYKGRYKQLLEPDDLDTFKRLMDVYWHLNGLLPVYGSFYSTQNQPIAMVAVPQIVTFNNTYDSSGVSIADNKIVFARAGVYQFSYVAQVFNSSNDIGHCEFWIKYNGVDYPNSATHITLPARKSSTEPSEQQMNLILTGTAQNDGDYIELYWQGSSSSLQLGYVGPGVDGPVGSPSIVANIIKI